MREIRSCPKCEQGPGRPVTMTWWGGPIGPWLLCHRRCGFCKTEYNGWTGGSNVIGIVISLLIEVTLLGGLIWYIHYLETV